MSGFLANFHLLEPWWLLFLLALPWLAWTQWRRQHGRMALARLADAELLPLLLTGTPRRRWLGVILLSLGWLLATLALAGPAWERLPAPMAQGGGAQVIALSLSSSMLAADLSPDRLTRARFKVRDLIKAGRGEQNALIAYAGDAFVVAPLTPDVDTVLNLVDALTPDTMPVDGNNAARAIDLGVKLLQQAGMRGGSIVLVTDAADAGAIEAARRAHAQGIRVSVLGVGSGQGAPVRLPAGGFLTDASGNIVIPKLETPPLRELASVGGGRYRTITTDMADVTALRVESGTSRLAATKGREARAAQWRDRGPWLLLPLLPLMALMFRRGWLAVLALVLVLPMGAVRAADVAAASAPAATSSVAAASASSTRAWWDALWRNRDQRAAAALAQGQAAQALQLAKNPGLRGAADYRAGKYADAASSFSAREGADAAYNQGNALARAAKYQQAIAAYDKALELAPGMDDALHNREVVEDALKQQQKQQDGQQGQQDQQGQQGQQGKQGKQGQPDQQGGQDQAGNPASAATADENPSDRQHSTDPQESKQPHGQDDAQAGQESLPAAAASSADDATTQDPASYQRQQQQQQEADQAVKKAMDQQLGQAAKAQPYRLGQASGPDDKNALPQPMRQALQRVPDDPGGLLRRKFQREYQLRQSRGGDQG